MANFTLTNNNVNFSLFANYSDFTDAVKGNTYHNLIMSSVGWVKWAKNKSTVPFTFTLTTHRILWGENPNNLNLTSIYAPTSGSADWIERVKKLFVEVTKQNSMLLCYADVTEVTGVYNKNGKEVKLPYQIVPTSGWYKYDLDIHKVTFFDEKKRPLNIVVEEGLKKEVVTSCPVLTLEELNQ